MGLSASAVHAHFRFHPVLKKNHLPLSLFISSSSSPPLIVSVGRYSRKSAVRRRCHRHSEDGNSSPTDEAYGSNSQTYDEAGKIESNTDDFPSTDDPKVTITPELRHGEVSSARTVALWICAALAFGIGVGLKEGVDKASEFFAGYLLEQSLSVDNLFIFVLIFKYFKVPIMYQNRVLSYGIAGAVIFRAIMILLGAATIQRFEAVNLLLGSILLYSAYKLFASEDEDTDLANNFIVKTCQKFIPITTYYDGDRFLTMKEGVLKATPLLLTVAVIELSDIAFAVDSIPAVFGVTRDPLIVFSSNIFAILGLRSLYSLISESMSELEYLQPAIAAVLGFIGCKLFLDFFGYHISTEVSLGFVATSLGAGLLFSLKKSPIEESIEVGVQD